MAKAQASSNLRAHSFSAGAAPGRQPGALRGAGSNPRGHRARLRGPGRARRVAAAPLEARLSPDPSTGLPAFLRPNSIKPTLKSKPAFTLGAPIMCLV